MDLATAIQNLPEQYKGDDYAIRIRKLTPRECFRLMDVDEDKIDILMQKWTTPKGKVEQRISNSQLYKMAGNSIVVSCMVGIFENLFFPKPKEPKKGEQLALF